MKTTPNRMTPAVRRLKSLLRSFETSQRGEYTIKLSVIGTPASTIDRQIASVQSVCVVFQNRKTEATLVKFFGHEDAAIAFIELVINGGVPENEFAKPY